MKIVDAIKKPTPHLSVFPLAAKDNCGSWQSTGSDFWNLAYSAVLEKCLHVPFCFSSFISRLFMHVNVLVTKEEREEKKSWSEIKLDTSINHSVCFSKYMT